MQFPDHLKNVVTGSVVEVAGWLIGQEEFRFTCQRPRDGDSLLLTPGNFANFVVKTMPQTDAVQNLTRDCVCVGFSVTADELRHHRILQGREFRQKMMELKDKPDVTVSKSRQFRSVPFENILIFKEHIASGRPVQTAKQVKQGALSSTRRTNYGDQTPAFDFEVNVFENENLRCRSFVDLRETSRLDHSYRSASTGWSFDAAAEG
jgi:hypothetical protein